MNEIRQSKMTQRLEFLAHAALFVHHHLAGFYLAFCVDFRQSKHISVVDMDTYRYRYLTAWNFRQRAEFLVHIVLLAHHSFTASYLEFCVDLTHSEDVSVSDMQTYRYRYLTTWNFMVQSFYLGMLTVAHVLRMLPQNERSIRAQKAISTARGFLFASLIFPTGLLVSGVFWTVWTINRELVFPKAADELLPWWANHSLHTVILAVLLVEMFFYKKMPTFRSAAKGALAFFLGYNVTFFFTYYQSSRWLYGMFAVLSWPERFLFMISNYVGALVLIKVCMFLQTAVHQRKLPEGAQHRLISKKLL